MKHGLDTGFLVAAEVVEHPNHFAVREKIASLVAIHDQFAMAPQKLAKFIHVVTDSRRFSQPLKMAAARHLAQKWWTAKEGTPIFPGPAAMAQFFHWHRQHRLGRKRILDTMLAATYLSGGIDSLLTLNADDLIVFGELRLITP